MFLFFIIMFLSDEEFEKELGVFIKEMKDTRNWKVDNCSSLDTKTR